MPILSNNNKILSNGSTSGTWRRPEDWLPMPMGITSADQTFVGLHAVIEDGDNFCAFLFTTSEGQYQVDWGDGTVDLVDSGVNAEHQYNFATYDTGNTTLSSRGYKQAMITVTPVSGDLLTCNFRQRFVTSPVQNQSYSTGFLDCILSMPNASSGASILFGGTTVRHSFVERFDIKTIGGATNLNSLFHNFSSIESIPLFNTSNVTSMQQMFSNCFSIQSIPLFDTASVTNMVIFLGDCRSLKSVPLFNTSSVTNIGSMLTNCTSLQYVPLFNTSNVTSMSNMFNGCNSIKSIPLFITTSVTNMVNMFLFCSSLNSIPALSTSAITPSTGTDFGTSFATACQSLNRCQMVFARTVSFQNCQLSRDAIVEIFNNLVDRSATTSATITITGNWGVTALSAGDLLIATNKNWVVTS